MPAGADGNWSCDPKTAPNRTTGLTASLLQSGFRPTN